MIIFSLSRCQWCVSNTTVRQPSRSQSRRVGQPRAPAQKAPSPQSPRRTSGPRASRIVSPPKGEAGPYVARQPLGCPYTSAPGHCSPCPFPARLGSWCRWRRGLLQGLGMEPKQLVPPALSLHPPPRPGNAQVAISPPQFSFEVSVSRASPLSGHWPPLPPMTPRDQPRALCGAQGARGPEEPDPDTQHSPCSHSEASSGSSRPRMARGGRGRRWPEGRGLAGSGPEVPGSRPGIWRSGVVHGEREEEVPRPAAQYWLRDSLPRAPPWRPAPRPPPIGSRDAGRGGAWAPGGQPRPASQVYFWSPAALG